MNMDLFTVYDMVAERYMKPFFGENVASALRGFGDACAGSSPEPQFAEHPEDYALYHIGEFNGETGMLTPMEPRKLATASSFIAPLDFSKGKDLTPSANDLTEEDRVRLEGRA